jgi:hypothetical protein
MMHTGLGISAYIVFGLIFVVSRAILHQDSPNNVRAMQTNLHVVLVIERHVGKDGDHGAQQVEVVPIHVQLEEVQDQVDEVQVS